MRHHDQKLGPAAAFQQQRSFIARRAASKTDRAAAAAVTCLPLGSFALETTPSGPAWWPGGRTAQNALAAWQAGGGEGAQGSRASEWGGVRAGAQAAASMRKPGTSLDCASVFKYLQLFKACSRLTRPFMTSSTAVHMAPAAASAAAKVPRETAVSPSR